MTLLSALFAACLATSYAADKDCQHEKDKRFVVEEELEALEEVALTWNQKCGLTEDYLDWCKTQPPRIVQLWGERHSGTNMAMQILRHNFKLANSSHSRNADLFPYKFKHAIHLYPGNEPDYEVPLEKAARDKATHVFMVRHPLAWIRSMWHIPHDNIHFKNLTLHDFVYAAWPFEEEVIKGSSSVLQAPPTPYASHDSIMKMRDFKLKFFLKHLRDYNVETTQVDPLNSVAVLFVQAERLFLDAGTSVACDFATKLKLCPTQGHVHPELIDVSPGTSGAVFEPPTKETFKDTLAFWQENLDIVDRIESQLNYTIEYDFLHFQTFDEILQTQDEAIMFGIV